MNLIKCFSLIPLLLLFTFPQINYSQEKSSNNLEDIRQSLNYFIQVYSQVNRHYVDEINSLDFVKSGLHGMLKTLDPYTELLSTNDSRRIQVITTGEYGGIGIEITNHKYGIMIANVMQNSPAGKHSISPGNIISSINKIKTTGKDLSEVSNLLKGNLGDEIILELYNPFTKKSKHKTLKRDLIKLMDVPYYGMLRKNIAYVKLTGFTENAADQLRSSILKLEENFVFENLILDLRDNPGGLLESAREIVNLFVEKGEIIVSTVGKHEGRIDYYASEDPLFPQLNLILLVNENTASAAEIVSGSLQDLDKAIILGTETYGKGLVQKVFSVNQEDDLKVKITTSKYYTPSGRSIQRNNRFVNTSLKTSNKQALYFTRNGRRINDASGVQPDIVIEDAQNSSLILSLIEQGFIFDFAIESINKDRSIKTHTDLEKISFQIFKDYMKTKNFSYKPAGLSSLEETLEIAINNNYDENLIATIKDGIEQTKKQIDLLLINNKVLIMNKIYEEISEKIWGIKGKCYSISKHDQLILKAIDLLNKQNSFKEILAYK
jgi:carboxyl-terminal processing protease